MSNVIDFLERYGRGAEMRHMSRELLEKALEEAGLDPALKAAILNADKPALEALLDIEPNVCCLIHKEDEEEEEEGEEEGEDEEEEEEDK